MDLRALPKVELHRHLEGSVRYGTFLEIAREAGIDLPRRGLKSRIRVGPRDPRTLRSFLKKFDLFRNLYPSRESVERVAREAVEDAARDGVVHLELRFSAVHFSRRMQCDPVECAGWIIAAAKRVPISVKFIVTLGRHFSAADNAPSLEAALAHRPDVVGIDVAGDEARPITPLVPFLKRARKAGLALTLHAGEARGPDSVREAIALGASRLGHGVRAVRDAALLKEVLRRGIAFELCPTSNVQTGAVRSLATHPLKRLLRAGHRVTLNTDDPAISGIDLTHEFGVARRLGLSAGDLDALTDHAVEAAFLTEGERKSLRRRVASLR